MADLLHNPHAGEILKSEFLEPLNLSGNALANELHVPSNRIHHIIKGQRGITADTDLRLCKFFGLSQGYFLSLQQDYEMENARRSITQDIATIRTHEAATEARI